MNSAELHLVFNHLPIVGVIIGVLVMIAGFLTRRPQVKATALGIFIFSALASIAAFMTGEEAEELIEHMSGVSHDLIHEHEESAEQFHLANLGLGVLSILAALALWKKWRFSNVLLIAVLLLGIADMGLATLAGHSGGEIRHPEVREGFQAAEDGEDGEDHDEEEDED